MILLLQTILYFNVKSETINCDQSNYCDCDHNPGAGDTYACYEDEIVCNAGSNCHIDCGHQGCQRGTIQCPNGYECNIYCTKFYACSETIINGNNASSLSIYGNDTTSTHHLYDANINCPNGQTKCSINCGNQYANCNKVEINGENTDSLSIKCGSDNADVCKEVNIYCPTSGSCNIAGQPSTQTMRQMNIFALHGFNSVIITGTSSVDSIGIMYCKDSYTKSCAIDGNNINSCNPSTIDKSCDASPTTNPTTISPTTSSPTTMLPTTVNPTTTSPTTSLPTTVNPSTTLPTTSYPTTASPITISPTIISPTTTSPTTTSPTTSYPTISDPTTTSPTTTSPTSQLTTIAPTNNKPITYSPTTYSPTVHGNEGRGDETTSNGGIQKTDGNFLVNDSGNNLWIYVVIAMFVLLVLVICVVVLWKYRNKKKGQKMQLQLDTNQRVLSSSEMNDKNDIIQMGQKTEIHLNGESKFEHNLVNNIAASNVMMDDVIDDMETPMNDDMNEGIGNQMTTNVININTDEDDTTPIEGTDSDDEIITDVNQYKTPNGVSDINDIDDLIDEQTPMEPNIEDDEFVIGSDTLK